MANKDELKSDMVADTPIDPDAPFLEVENLHVEFHIEDGTVKAVNGLSYKLAKHETLAILGESGSGKSVSAQAVMGILDTPPGFVTQGSVKFRGVDLLELPEKVMAKQVRGQKIAMISEATTISNPSSRGYPFAGPPKATVICRSARSFISTTRFHALRRTSKFSSLPW